MKVSIIGLGLIGGSYALSLKKRFEEITIYGWDENPKHLTSAKKLGIIDFSCHSIQNAIDQSDWIYLAFPVDAIESSLVGLLDYLAPEKVLIDFGSTKKKICEKVFNHAKRHQFIAAHPIAGTEYSGPQSAFSNLYEDKVMIVCEQNLTESGYIDKFRKQCKTIGMTTTYMTAHAHDIHLAYVSHLSHLISYGLSRTVLQKEENDNEILQLAGSGFASTVRLAKSSPDMWAPIFMKNKENILESLNSYMAMLGEFKQHLESEDYNKLYDYLEKGRKIRKILD